MANKPSNKQPIDRAPLAPPVPDFPLEEPLPSANDPGGAHAKGYSAESQPDKDVPAEGPLPLASVPDDGSHIRQRERDGNVRPTGRSEPRDYTPNDRLMGSDR